MTALTEAIYAIALTLWIGGLWAIGYIVAPTLFYSVPDRALAGALAGKLFTLIAYVGIGCAIYLVLFRLVRFGGACAKHGIFWIVLAILASLKDQALPKGVMESVFRDRFAAWHGVASVLYLIQTVLGVLLVWLHARKPR